MSNKKVIVANMETVEEEKIGVVQTNNEDKGEGETEAQAPIKEGKGEGEGVKRPRKRRQTSEAWNHFTKLPLTQTKGVHKAKCNHCGIEYASHPSQHGTKQLLRHLEKCPKNPNKAGKSQSIFASTPKGTLTHQQYSEERCRKAIAKFIIKDEMPFRTVEGEGFKEMMQEVEPRFKVPSRWTIARDCLQLYLEEAKGLKRYFKRSKVRVSLTTDCWTSIQNANYMCLTAHWIDDDWTLQKRILNFCVIENHKGETIGKEIETCLLNWRIDKVLTVTVDNASANNTAVAYLRKRLRGWNGLVLNGEFMQMRCAAHILNLIVSEGLKEIHRSIELIRHAVKFVRSSPSRLNRFKELVVKERVEFKGLLTLDCPTRWNSTYLMLESAVKFIKVFDRMEEEDLDYKEYFKKKVRLESSVELLNDVESDELDTCERSQDDNDGLDGCQPPTAYDWSVAKEFLNFLRIFYAMTLKFSASNYVTSNTCFQHIVAIHSSLKSSANSPYSLLSDMALKMQSKYDKYWGNMEKMNPLLLVSMILDPRYKTKYLELAFQKIFTDPSKRDVTLKKVINILHRLYDEYESTIKPHNDASSSQAKGEQVDASVEGNVCDSTPEVDVPLSTIDPLMVEYMTQANMACKKPEKHSEVDEYLRSDIFGFNDSNFDVLAWWKVNSSNYKVLHLIARDLLATPVSTVSSESAFSTGGRVLDSFRSSLSSKTVEALICAQNWLRTTPPKLNEVDDNFNESISLADQELISLAASTLSSDDSGSSDDDGTMDLEG